MSFFLLFNLKKINKQINKNSFSLLRGRSSPSCKVILFLSLLFYCPYDFDCCIWFWFICYENCKKKNWNNKHCIITICGAIGAISILYICFYGAKGKKLSTKWGWSQRMKKVQEMASFSYPIFSPFFSF